ncbi:MAG TPA: hypothetical protein VIV60_25515 [Polyangiaceae bacterium]
MDQGSSFRIGLDLDGVVARWSFGAVDWLNSRFGYTLDPAFEPPEWDWLEKQVAPEHWKALWNRALDEHLFRDWVRPYNNARPFVHELTKLGQVVVMTSRPKGAWKDTIEWWFIQGFPVVSGYNFFLSGKEKKHVHVNVLIEDNADNANAYGGPVLLLDRPYNRLPLEANVQRVYTLDEALIGVAKLAGGLDSKKILAHP